MRNDTGWEENPQAGEVHPHCSCHVSWCQPGLNLDSPMELLHQNTSVTSFVENIQSFLEGSKLLVSEQDFFPMDLFSFGVSAVLLWLSLCGLCAGKPWDEDIPCP